MTSKKLLQDKVDIMSKYLNSVCEECGKHSCVDGDKGSEDYLCDDCLYKNTFIVESDSDDDEEKGALLYSFRIDSLDNTDDHQRKLVNLLELNGFKKIDTENNSKVSFKAEGDFDMFNRTVYSYRLMMHIKADAIKE